MSYSYTPTPAFFAAAKAVEEVHAKHDQSLQLLAYALYKQAKVGNVQGSQPGFFELKARKKFAAWTLAEGTAREVADALYVNCSKHMEAGEALHDENRALLARIREST